MVSDKTAGLGQQFIDGARLLYADIAQELARAVSRLRQDHLAEESKQLADMLKAHRKALQTVLEFELSFEKTQKEEEPKNDLDLEAARAEIGLRFDRLIAAGGDRKPD